MNNFDKTLNLLQGANPLDECLTELKQIANDNTLTESVIRKIVRKIGDVIASFDHMSPEEEKRMKLIKSAIEEIEKYGKIKSKSLLAALI